MMRTGPPDDRGALRGRAHFLFDNEGCCLFTAPVQPRLRVDSSLYFSVADVLLMSNLMREMSAGREDWLTDWLGAGHGREWEREGDGRGV